LNNEESWGNRSFQGNVHTLNQWENTILLVNKVPGLTSFDTIRKIKGILGVKKIGHTGTLDKFAEGLLILLTGKYTRLASLFLELTKEYVADIELGKTTDTLDPEGVITATGPVPELEKIKTLLPAFTGELNQVPPLFSAVHHEGERAYKLVRSGQSPDLKPRKIQIYQLELINYNPPQLTLRVKCSKGTYIRSLARDLGIGLGTCGYVTRLKRTCIGKYKLADAMDWADIDQAAPSPSCIELIKAMEGIGHLTVKTEYQQKILTGSLVSDQCFLETDKGGIPEGRYFVFNHDNCLLAAMIKSTGKYSYISVLEKGRS